MHGVATGYPCGTPEVACSRRATTAAAAHAMLSKKPVEVCLSRRTVGGSGVATRAAADNAAVRATLRIAAPLRA
ncbi:hypothetical protein [Streptomyces sp. NPDC001292]|uniref:hypothetical protein n=1 Tax=Streptomyces sp. NPDC001292 TaxID=3364558 RepID=UPI0036A63BFC